ncbi:hypothetical protein SADUNF_Sadunf09G0087200 [Salix dunnii]|uniref:Uncharacterized protein n=1 Tax=Salix dunnii TaxID=1413687 RepID=A0A835MTE5_9ROSI|nr:hypothetical protein SADUNF_Sadunf09G0087200 [Salix dunnii]
MIAACCAEGEMEMASRFGLEERDTLIAGYFQNGCQVKPLKMLLERGGMVLDGMRILLLTFLSSCADLRNLEGKRHALENAIRAEIEALNKGQVEARERLLLQYGDAWRNHQIRTSSAQQWLNKKIEW